MPCRSVTGHSKVENVGQNSSAKYPQQVKQFWRASVTDLLLKSFFFFSLPALSTNDSISPAIACFLSHSCAIQKDGLCVSLWSWLSGPGVPFPCLDGEAVTNRLFESIKPGFWIKNECAFNIKCNTFNHVKLKTSSKAAVFFGFGILVGAESSAFGPSTSEMGA